MKVIGLFFCIYDKVKLFLQSNKANVMMTTTVSYEKQRFTLSFVEKESLKCPLLCGCY
jgi:hypothetical protein